MQEQVASGELRWIKPASARAEAKPIRKGFLDRKIIDYEWEGEEPSREDVAPLSEAGDFGDEDGGERSGLE
jgi:hypothetical protein